MTISLFKTVGTKVVVGAIFFSLLVSPVSTFAQSSEGSTQTTDLAAQLNTLTAALSSIGAAIAGAGYLSENDRYNLLSQLIVISSQIMALRGSSTYVPVDPYSGEATKDTAREAGLTRVRTTFNPATNEAVTDVTVRSRTTRTTYSFPELASSPIFMDKLVRLREILALRVSNDLNVKYDDVTELLQVTARDPIRASVVPVNSSAATYLANNFAQHSILTRIKVLPGVNVGKIRIFTDQDDSVELTLARMADSEGYVSSSGNFTYTREYFINDRLNPYTVYDSSSESMVPQPRAFDSDTDISQAEVEVFLMFLYNDIPFTSRISNFGSKLVRFLVDNGVSYDGSSGSDTQRDCYSSGDKLVVDEFIEFVVDGLEAQYDDIPSITHYLAPLVSDDRGSGCSSRSRIF